VVDPILAEAKRLWDLGFAIHWLRPKSKIPVEAGWTTGPRKDWNDLRRQYRKGSNIGVRLGSASVIRGLFLAVVDLDIKSRNPQHCQDALKVIKEIIGSHRCPVVRSGRGGGSRHYYYLTDKPFKTFNPAQATETVRVRMPSKRPSRFEREKLTPEEIAKGTRLSKAWEISLYSEGRQVVLPPSIHPDTGEAYRWSRPIGQASDLPLLRLGTASNEGKNGSHGKPRGPASRASSLQSSEGKGSGARESYNKFKVEKVELDWLPISPSVRDGIKDLTGVEDRSGFLLRASAALISAGLTGNEVLSVLTDPKNEISACAYEHAKTDSRERAAEWLYRYTVGRVEKERSPKGVFPVDINQPRKLTPEEVEKQTTELEEERNWRQDLDKTKEGKAKITLKNLDLILSNMVDENVFIEDHFATGIVYGCKTPWGGKKDQPILDIDMVKIKRWLADTEFGMEPTKEAIFEVTNLIADRRKIHPVKDWLSSLKWDGKKRIDTWIRDFCKGHASEPYLSEISRKFLIAMVKRIFEPGCQWDYVLVLEGKQGIYKSTIARTIASERWFIDHIPDLRDKDSMLNIQGKWLVELAELADVKRADYNQVKAYLTRRIDTVRPHYGRLKRDIPRQSVFIGTINEGQYLKDPTGNRRYWPVRVGKCDPKALAKVRDQLFAEAMHVYQTTDEVLMLSPKADRQATEIQEDRRVDDDASEMKEAFIHFQKSEAGKNFDFDRFRTRDLMIGISAPWGPWASKMHYASQIASHVLTSLGFKRHKSDGQRYWKSSGQGSRAGQGSPEFYDAPFRAGQGVDPPLP
jgi:predicted P-loop ATPase